MRRSRLFKTLLVLGTLHNLAWAAPVNPKLATAKFKRLGLHLNLQDCQITSYSEGAGRQISFTEGMLDCGDVRLQLESSDPVQAFVVQNQVDAEVARVNEVYGAAKNPYAGYVSQTANCPDRKNIWQQKLGRHPLLIGRVTARGAWGACGESDQDHWAALAFLQTDKALIKVRVVGKTQLSRALFETRARQLLTALKDRK